MAFAQDCVEEKYLFVTVNQAFFLPVESPIGVSTNINLSNQGDLGIALGSEI